MLRFAIEKEILIILLTLDRGSIIQKRRGGGGSFILIKVALDTGERRGYFHLALENVGGLFADVPTSRSRWLRFVRGEIRYFAHFP